MRASPSSSRAGLGALRRGGTVTELLLLYECATVEPTHLQPIAERLGLTIQAISHSFRQLRARHLVEVRDGRYRPTVEGVAWLHGTLTSVGDDLFERGERLHIIRSCRAIAASALPPGTPVSLELHEGLLTARPARDGASRGVVARGGAAGALIEVTDLEGITVLPSARVFVVTLSETDLGDPDLPRRLGRALPRSGGLLLAEGLEAYHATRSAIGREPLRFAVSAVAREASRVGVSSTVVLMERDFTRWVSELGLTNSPPLEVQSLSRRARNRRAGPRAR